MKQIDLTEGEIQIAIQALQIMVKEKQKNTRGFKRSLSLAGPEQFALITQYIKTKNSEIAKIKTIISKLFAARSELLEALKYLFENAEAQGWSEFMLSDARKAIAKAEGRE